MLEEKFLLDNFKGFYAGHKAEVPSVSEREFGIGSFGKKIARRHLSFNSNAELNAFLRSNAPLFISYSLAYYSSPSATPMDRKDFLGGDIVYEFDADDIKTECKQRHDSWQCLKCGASGKGILDNCPKCGAAVKKEQWFCPECLRAVKKQVFSLLGLLESDFGFGEVSINFSGNAGYHIHLRGDGIKGLGREARIELLDYLTAKDLDFARHGFAESGKMFLCPLEGGATGWGKKLLDSLIRLFEEGDAERIAALGGVSFAKASALLESKELVLKNMREKGILFSIPGRKNKQFWLSLLQHFAGESSLDIDRQTSVDMKKIIRVPNTLHGGTGLNAVPVSVGELRSFNPFDSAVVFGDGRVKVFINKSPKFYLKHNWFGPFEQAEVELPLHAALYLVAKGKAKLVG